MVSNSIVPYKRKKDNILHQLPLLVIYCVNLLLLILFFEYQWGLANNLLDCIMYIDRNLMFYRRQVLPSVPYLLHAVQVLILIVVKNIWSFSGLATTGVSWICQISLKKIMLATDLHIGRGDIPRWDKVDNGPWPCIMWKWKPGASFAWVFSSRWLS